MYARGATPERPHVAGWSRPPGEHVPESPAAIPATCVAWKEALRSTASRPRRPEFGPGNARATITFGDVHLRPPRGKPGGYASPSGARKGFVLSTPSSTIPILTPSPRAPVSAFSSSAPITPGLVSVSRWYVALG